MKVVFKSFLFASLMGLMACSELQKPDVDKDMVLDPLLSWNEGKIKSEIIQFVEAVSDSGNTDFIPVKDRIAVFDNDGTLWSEQPMYFQLFFAIDRLKSMQGQIEQHEAHPLKTISKEDMHTFLHTGEKGLLELVMKTHAGMHTDEFESLVKQWIDTARHPETGRLYTEMVFQPMLELLDYLKEHEFKCFIVSGGGIEFMRPWAETVYGIPKDQIIGSSIKTEFVNEDGKYSIKRLPELDFLDDKEGKPLAINRFIGRKPIFCAGNSDGDLQMMQWTASGEGRRMMMYVHHTDSLREYAYDRGSSIGCFDIALDYAVVNNWALVNIKEDWKVVFQKSVDQR